MFVTGRCHCGEITYEAEIDPEAVSICHCTDCQRLTGSPFRVTALVPADAVRLTAGQPKRYRKIGENGRGRLQLFCPNCGAPLFTTGEGADAAVWGIRWGSIDQRAALSPKRQFWCRSAVDWLAGIQSLPGTDGDD